jgi:hypothetical protein
VLADRAYDNNDLRKTIAEMNAEAVIPSTRSRKVPIPHDQALYKLRNRIERCFNKLKHFRRFATRYDDGQTISSPSSTSPQSASGSAECGFFLGRDLDDGLSEAAAVEHSHECTNGLVESVGNILPLADGAISQSADDLCFEFPTEFRKMSYDETADGETLR